MTDKILKSRLNTFLVLFSCGIIVLLFQLIYIQIIKGGYYRRLAEQNTARYYIQHAPRGTVYDKNGFIVAKNRPVPKIFFYPFGSLQKLKQINEEFSILKEILPSIEIRPEWYSSKNIICIAENIPLLDVFRIMEQKSNLPDINLTMEYIRYFPYCEIGSHILGYVGEIDKYELVKLRNEGYVLGDFVGKTGIEKQYDRYLRGIPGGLFIESDVRGKEVRVVKNIEPKRGADIYLTVDMNLQKIAEMELYKTGCAGAVVGLDPNDGAVRILASYPSFDPNIFLICSDRESMLKYLKDNKNYMYNRAIQGLYTPGSVFKIITALAALDGKKINPEKSFLCTGEFKVGKRVFKCWKEKGHGRMSFISGIKESCDVYFYNIGLETGIDLIVDYAKKFQLNEITGIDLPSEKRGFLPEYEWRRKKNWYDGDTVNVSIGQGYLVFTPIELASMISSVANGGIIWQPYIVEKIVHNDSVLYQNKPRRKGKIEISEVSWQILKHGLREVVKSGTGYLGNIEWVDIAGKTGTAQNPGEDHALFIAYAPVDNPTLALAIVVEHGGKGGEVAAPIARKIFMEAFKNKEEIQDIKISKSDE